MFSGGSYDEVGRWLANFVTSHAKRENPRAEVTVDAGDEREGRSYGVRLRVGRRLGAVIDLDYRDVADHRETLAWVRALADRIRGEVRELAGATGAAAGKPE